MGNRKEITQDIVDALTDIFYMFGGNGRLMRWNRALAEVSGYSDGELSDMTVYDLLAEEDAERLVDFYRDLLAEEHVDAMATLITRDGRPLSFHFRSTLLRDAEGEPYAVCGIGGDVTERLEMEEALRKSERYYRSLIENSYDAVTVLDEDGSMRYLSPSFERMTGYSPGELTGMNAFDFIHPDDVARMAEVFFEGIKEPYLTVNAEYRYRHADGTWHYLEAVGRNLLEDESVRGIVVNYRDITSRREMEEALRESEERFRTIANNAKDAIIMIDDQAIITYWNPSAGEIFGYGADEVMDKPLSSVLMPESAHGDFREAMSSFAHSGEAEVIGTTREMVARKKDGSSVPIEVSLSSLRMGGRWYAVGIARDITERKRAEERLRAANRELESFAHTLSHDLRVPLSNAYGYASVLRKWGEGRLGEDALEWVNEIVVALRRMESFISSLLEYARAGLPAGKSAWVDPEKVVDEALSGLGTRLCEEEAEVTVEGELPAVEVDAMRLSQVLYNLLDNAIKFKRGDTAARIEISAERDGDMVVFKVRDNGIGLPKEELQSIFDPFIRPRSGAGRPGLGIGLSTVKRAVEGWGGRVWADSSPGEGTSFHFTVPAAR